MTARRQGPGDEPGPGVPPSPEVLARLPPGQRVAQGWPVLHYGRAPAFRPATWDLRVLGATADGREHRWTWPELGALPRTAVEADLHCVTRFTVPGLRWEGVATRTLLALAPPSGAATHVLVWAERGYSAALPLADFGHPAALLATAQGGADLTREHGFPLRLVVPHLYAWKGPKWVRAVEYLTGDQPGFWESRGYSVRGDVWREQRYAHDDDTDLGD